MKIAIAELRTACKTLLDQVEASGIDHVEIADDYYWDVPADSRYRPYEKPTDLTLGQLTDDWAEIERLVAGTGTPVAYSLVWLAAILRRTGEIA